MASRMSRNANALPSSTARVMWARVWAKLRPENTARAAPFHSGAMAPCRHGRKTTPPAPGGTRDASALSRS